MSLYWSFIRIEYCPARLPASFFKRLLGGTCKSISLDASLSMKSFRSRTVRMFAKHRHGCPSKTAFVSLQAKDWITLDNVPLLCDTSSVSLSYQGA
jgi:hypothetical protein